MNIFKTTIPSWFLVEYIPTYFSLGNYTYEYTICIPRLPQGNSMLSYFKRLIHRGRVAWWIALLSANRKVVGSNPTREGFLVCYKFNPT